MRKARVLITQGDAAGIGPELIVRAFEQPELREHSSLCVIGDAAVMRAAIQDLGAALEVHTMSAPAQAAELPEHAMGVIDLGIASPERLKIGAVDAAAGEASVRAIHLGSDLIAAGEADAIVSAPANKVSIHAAGHRYPGQTEIFLERWGVARDHAHIMLLGAGLRVSLVTAHCSMRQALERITQERVERIARQAQATLRDLFAIEDPYLGVAGLNCHAGDEGLFGHEEIDAINPAVAALRAEGLRLTEARPADALFHEAENGAYDGVLAMYHDQGVIPLKREGYVTVIAGIPHVRTTCGHGTAYDIAWRGGKAAPGLFLRALDPGADLARMRLDV